MTGSLRSPVRSVKGLARGPRILRRCGQFPVLTIRKLKVFRGTPRMTNFRIVRFIRRFRPRGRKNAPAIGLLEAKNFLVIPKNLRPQRLARRLTTSISVIEAMRWRFPTHCDLMARRNHAFSGQRVGPE